MRPSRLFTDANGDPTGISAAIAGLVVAAAAIFTLWTQSF